MPTTCVLVFDRVTPIYFAGDQVGGNIVLTNTKAMRLDGVVIKCKGFAQVNWYEKLSISKTPEIAHNDSTDDAAHQQVHYHDEEIYIDEDIIVDPHPLTLDAGRHDFQFSFRLPEYCPSTCSVKYGDISYRVSLILKRRSKHDKRFERRFLVKKRRALETESTKENKTFDNCLGVCFSTSRSGFLPGQNIRFCLETALDTAVFGKYQVRLSQRYVFQSRRHPLERRKEVVYKLVATKSDLDPRTRTQEGSLRVPLLAPLTMDKASGIISVSYQLEAILYRSDKRKQVLTKLVIPIVLGSKLPPETNDSWTEKIPFIERENNLWRDNDLWSENELRSEKDLRNVDDHRLIRHLPRISYDNTKFSDLNEINQRYSILRSESKSNVFGSRDFFERRPLLVNSCRRDSNVNIMPYANDVCMQLLMIL